MKIICKARPGPKNWAWAQARAQKIAHEPQFSHIAQLCVLCMGYLLQIFSAELITSLITNTTFQASCVFHSGRANNELIKNTTQHNFSGGWRPGLGHQKM